MRASVRRIALCVPHESKRRAMARPARRDQQRMHRLRAIVGQRLAVDVGQRAAGFVHQKVGCGKVPVVAVAADDGDVDLAMRDAGEPQRQRTDPRQRHHRRMQFGQRAEEPLRAEQLGAVEPGARPDLRSARRSGSRPRPRPRRRIRRSPAQTARASRGRPRDRQRDRDHPVLAAVEIGAGAVDRIDDPDRIGLEPLRIVLGFLRQPAIGGERAASFSRSSASTAISASLTGDDFALDPLPQRAAEGLERERAGLAHGRTPARSRSAGDHRPATVRPSTRTVGALVA